MGLDRRTLLAGLVTGAATIGASEKAAALGMRDASTTPSTPDIDKPFVHVPFDELAQKLAGLSERGDTDTQFIVRLAVLPNGEKVYRVIEEPVPPHPLPKKWRKFEMP